MAAAAGPRDRSPAGEPPERDASQDKLSDEAPPLDEVRRKAIHQPIDKSAKGFYGDKGIVDEFLRKHVFGRIVADVELAKLRKGPTEYVDSKSRTVRHADMVWKAPFRDSWLYVVFLFEAQSTVDWRMPMRILLETALVYEELAKEPEVQKRRKLPPVLPIVVYLGAKPWDAPTRLEEMLAEEAMAELRELEDLASPVVETWWAAERREARRKGLEEGRREGRRQGRQEGEARARLERRATLVRLARRKFGSETAEGLAALLEGAADLEGVAEVADLIIDCGSGRDFLAQAAEALA